MWENRDFKWIWIPKEIWLCTDLTLQEKVFLVEIDSLDNEIGCYANNDYFSRFFWVSKTRVSLIIKSLIDKWFLESEILEQEWNRRILKVKDLFNKVERGSLTKIKEGLKQKLKHNNTVNNTSNNINISNDILIEKIQKNERNIIQELKEILSDYEFLENLKNKFWVDNEIIKSSAENFIIYWTEKNPKWTKVRWEMQKVFDTKRRFYTWIWNNKNFSRNKASIHTTGVVVMEWIF